MLKLVTFPNPTLKKTAQPWDFEKDTGAEELEVSMVQLMIESNGIGLAGNQVGLLKRVFAIRLKDRVPFCMFNPRVVEYGAYQIESEEGCLSFPDLFIPVKRHDAITAEYFDRQGNKCIIELNDIDARCFLHELDHLNGVCFTDSLSTLKLAMIRKRQQKKKRK